MGPQWQPGRSCICFLLFGFCWFSCEYICFFCCGIVFLLLSFSIFGLFWLIGWLMRFALELMLALNKRILLHLFEKPIYNQKHVFSVLSAVAEAEQHRDFEVWRAPRNLGCGTVINAAAKVDIPFSILVFHICNQIIFSQVILQFDHFSLLIMVRLLKSKQVLRQWPVFLHGAPFPIRGGFLPFSNQVRHPSRAGTKYSINRYSQI